METLPVMTTEIALVLSIVALAVFLFVTEIVRVDVAAMLVMTLLGLLIFLPGLDSLLGPGVLFSGFSSNAVISIIAVMILGAGLDKSGVMESVAWAVLKFGGKTEKRIVSLVSGTVGLLSSFMQNVGAAALFLPVVSRVSSRTGLPLSRLLMPMGFCAILGGTMTMVGSSPLIMLNDLLSNANRRLPPEQAMDGFGLFDVTPVGLALIVTGLLYFVFFGRQVLPDHALEKVNARGAGTVRYLRRVYGLDAAVREVEVPLGSPMVGQDILTLQRKYEVRIVASRYAGKVLVCPPIEAPIGAPAVLAVIAQRDALKEFVGAGGLVLRPKLKEFRHLLARSIAGVAEIVLPPDSTLIGKSVRELLLRMTYGLSLLSIFRAGESITTKLQDVPLQAGDTLVCHTRWENLSRLEKDRDLVIVTSGYPRAEQQPYKIALAVGFLLVSLMMILFTGVSLPVSLLTGATGMIVFGVLTMDEAYTAVSWKTVFLLAGLLPLGHAVETSGAANYLAQHALHAVGDVPAWGLQALVAVLGTLFSLVMSNVGATVLLVPIAINLALSADADPAMFALTVAIATSNSFLIPTHQVNALISGPGGYRVKDFLKAGSVMTVLFLVVSLVIL
ncbi:MAG: SLC13 family permease, partial [Pseudomonadota bacterium]